MQTATSKLLVALSLCMLVQTSVVADDAEFTRTVDGVTVSLLAVSDGAGRVWNPAGGLLGTEASDWSPEYPANDNRRGASRNGCFLIRVTGENIENVSVAATMSDANFRSFGGSGVRSDRGQNDSSGKLFQARGVFPADVESTTIEVLIGDGKWEDEGTITSAGNTSYAGTLRDGGRQGSFLLQTTRQSGETEQVAAKERRVERIAVASVAMRDTEHIADDYRLIARDVEGQIIKESTSINSAGYHMLIILECPTEDGGVPPAEFVFQQRPKNAVMFENTSLNPTAP